SLGYLLRYPTPTIVDFSNVSTNQWRIFFAVDVLQLIGFGLLFIILISWAAEKFKLSDFIVYPFFALFFFVLHPVFSQINWIDYFPAPVAGYFYRGTGSLFPLFPWAGYVVAGAILGSFLAKNPDIFKSTKFSLYLAGAGAVLIISSYILQPLHSIIYGSSFSEENSLSLSFFRLGFVLMLNSLVSFISLSIE